MLGYVDPEFLFQPVLHIVAQDAATVQIVYQGAMDLPLEKLPEQANVGVLGPFLAKVANLFDLSKRFDLNPEIVKDMLGVWINKGKVRKVPKCTGCAVKCVSCNPLLTEIYEWVGG